MTDTTAASGKADTSSEPVATPDTPPQEQKLSPHRQLAELLWRGERSPAEVLGEMDLSANQAKLLLAKFGFRRLVDTIIELCRHQQRLAPYRASMEGVNALIRLSEGNGETARKASLDLLGIPRPDKGDSESGAANAPPPPAEPMGQLEQRIESLIERLAAEGEPLVQSTEDAPTTAVKP